jgi:hypothetical protein
MAKAEKIVKLKIIFGHSADCKLHLAVLIVMEYM